MSDEVLHKNIQKNSIIQIVGKIASLVLGLVVVAIMTRYLGTTGFGQYTTVNAYLQVFGILVEFGLALTAVQMISRSGAPTEKIMSNIMTLRVISSAVFIGLASAIVWFLPYSVIVKVGVGLTAGSYFCVTLIQTLTSIFQKELRMVRVAIAELVGRVLLLLGVAGAAIWSGHIYLLFIFISLASIANLAILYYYSRPLIRLRLAFDWGVWREIWSRTWPIALSISFNLIYLRMDTLILSFVRPPADVGLYGASYRVVDILTNLPAVYMGIVLPHLTNYFSDHNFDGLRRLMQRVFDSLMMFAVPIVLGTYLVARPVMVFVAGPDFGDSGEVLKILILAVGAIFVTSLFGYMVLAVNRQRTMLWGYLSAAIITLVGYLIFIPIYGYWAAAWMTVISECLVAVFSFIVVYREVKFIPGFKSLARYILATAPMLLILFLLASRHIVWQLLVAGLVYLGTLYLLGGLDKKLLKFWRPNGTSK